MLSSTHTLFDFVSDTQLKSSLRGVFKILGLLQTGCFYHSFFSCACYSRRFTLNSNILSFFCSLFVNFFSRGFSVSINVLRLNFLFIADTRSLWPQNTFSMSTAFFRRAFVPSCKITVLHLFYCNRVSIIVFPQMSNLGRQTNCNCHKLSW